MSSPGDSDPLEARGLRLRKPYRADAYELFLSSSDEVSGLRDRVQSLVNESFNPRLYETAGAVIQVVRWEQEVAQKAPGMPVNALFVERARRSHLTLVLLMTHFGAGTREEVEAALEEDDVQLSVLRFALPAGQTAAGDPQQIKDFFRPLQDRLLYDERDEPDSQNGWEGVVKTLFGFALAAYEASRAEGPHGELR